MGCECTGCSCAGDQVRQDALADFTRISLEKVKMLLDGGGIVVSLAIETKAGSIATVDRFGKVTWVDV